MTALHVTQRAAALGIVHPAACLISGIDPNAPSSPDLDASIAEVTARIGEDEAYFDSDAAHAFRALFAEMGYPSQMPAGERLARLIQKRGFKRINSLIDAYNVVSARIIAGLGLHDAGSIGEAITVDRAAGTEMIVPIFKTEALRVNAGDLIYRANGALIAWLGKRDVDSKLFRVTDQTRQVVLVALGNRSTTEGDNRRACEQVIDLLRTCNSAVSASFFAVERE